MYTIHIYPGKRLQKNTNMNEILAYIFLFLWHFSCGPTGPQFINSDLCEQACPLRYVCDPVIYKFHKGESVFYTH